jgi:hypothetical protein
MIRASLKFGQHEGGKSLPSCPGRTCMDMNLLLIPPFLFRLWQKNKLPVLNAGRPSGPLRKSVISNYSSLSTFHVIYISALRQVTLL